MKLTKEQHERLDATLATAKTFEDVLDAGGPVLGLIGDIVQQLMQADMSEHLGYDKHAPNGYNGGNSRNGTSKKRVATTLGSIVLDVPRDREGTFDPTIVKKHERRLGKLEDIVLFMYASGSSTRDIQEHFEETYGAEISPATISRITSAVVEEALEWQNRRLDATYPIVFFDAIHHPVRDDGMVVTKAAYTCLAIRCDGTKELLGIWIGNAESASFWTGVMTDLLNRGVKDILIACVDGITGFANAMNALFPKTTIQRCIIHQVRNSLRHVVWKDSKAVMKDMAAIYKAPNEEAALHALDQLEENWGKKYPHVITSWRTNWPDLSAFLRYPPELRRAIYTTNAVESYHRQIRKVTKNKGAFPNDEALRKLLYLNHLRISKKWTTKIPNWPLIYAQLILHFGDRMTLTENCD